MKRAALALHFLLLLVLTRSSAGAPLGQNAVSVQDWSSSNSKNSVAKSSLLSQKSASLTRLHGAPAHKQAAARDACIIAPDVDTIQTIFSEDATHVLPRLKEPSFITATQDNQFDLEKAKLLGSLTSVAYCSNASVIQEWACTRCQRVADFAVHSVVFDLVWDLLAYVGYHAPLDAIVVVFRGTDSRSWGNWINNLRAWRQDKTYPVPEVPHAFVHSGFFNMWTGSALQPNITAAVTELRVAHPDSSLYVTGHSMGGALCQLCALDLKFKFNFNHVHSFTFGSPRVGNAAYQELFDSAMTESWRFTHNRDIVPSLPPQFIGFHHVPREVWIVDVDTPLGAVEKVLMCDESGEDPSCHNSACYLGLCTSVADHLDYLGIPMYRNELEC